jgi:hypothetical protein
VGDLLEPATEILGEAAEATEPAEATEAAEPAVLPEGGSKPVGSEA